MHAILTNTARTDIKRGHEMTGYKRYIIAVVTCVFAVASNVPTTVRAAIGPMNFASVGTHPQAAAQPTASGKQIHTLAVDGTKMVMGYGDWNTNTGPMVINPFDLTSETFDGVALTIPGESISTIRTINGKLYIPNTDPQSYDPLGYATNQSGTWVYQNTGLAGVHTFDITTRDGSDLWLFGSKFHPTYANSSTATAWHSTDGGTTWSEAYTDDTIPAQDNQIVRYYWGASVNSHVYMQARDATPQPPLRVYDGVSWSDGIAEPACPYQDAQGTVVFAGNIVCIGMMYNQQLIRFDGTNSYPITIKNNDTVVDMYAASDGYLYVLSLNSNTADTNIYRSNDLSSWQQVTSTTIPTSNLPRSLAVYNDRLYLGMSDGQLFKSDRTVSQALNQIGQLTPDDNCFNVQSGYILAYYRTIGDIIGAPACPGGNIVIPQVIASQTIIGIGGNAFGSRNLTSVTIPQTVTSIGGSAFSANQLTSISLPPGLTYLGFGAFSDNLLTSVDIPPGISQVNGYTFYHNHLTSVTLHEGVTQIDLNAFGYNAITDVVIPTSVVAIAPRAFEAQSSMANLQDELYSNDVARTADAINSIWYVQLYTADPTNPSGLASGATFTYEGYTNYDQNNDGDTVDFFPFSGFIINPAYATTQFQTQESVNLRNTIVAVGPGRTDFVFQRGPAVPIPEDPSFPTPAEDQAVREAIDAGYYKAGQTYDFIAPDISDYRLLGTSPVTSVLGIGNNNHIFRYQPTGLASTGNPVVGWIVLGLTAILLGTVMVLKLPRRASGFKLGVRTKV